MCVFCFLLIRTSRGASRYQTGDVTSPPIQFMQPPGDVGTAPPHALRFAAHEAGTREAVCTHVSAEKRVPSAHTPASLSTLLQAACFCEGRKETRALCFWPPAACAPRFACTGLGREGTAPHGAWPLTRAPGTTYRGQEVQRVMEHKGVGVRSGIPSLVSTSTVRFLWPYRRADKGTWALVPRVRRWQEGPKTATFSVSLSSWCKHAQRGTQRWKATSRHLQVAFLHSEGTVQHRSMSLGTRVLPPEARFRVVFSFLFTETLPQIA